VSDFQKLLKIDSLNEMIKNFFFLQTLFRSPEDFSYVVSDVAAYAKRNNIWYMELYIAPSMVVRQGFVTFNDMLDPIVEGFEALAGSGGPDVRLLVDVSRSFGFDNAKRNLDYLLAYLKHRPGRAGDRKSLLDLQGRFPGGHGERPPRRRPRRRGSGP
jgi:adenosine deaminase